MSILRRIHISRMTEGAPFCRSWRAGWAHSMQLVPGTMMVHRRTLDSVTFMEISGSWSLGRTHPLSWSSGIQWSDMGMWRR